MTQVDRKRKKENQQRGPEDLLPETVFFKEFFLKLYLITCLSAKGLRKVVF